MKDIYSLEKAYLEVTPKSGYLTDIMNLETFPDYIDYLPEGAIVQRDTQLVVEAIEKYKPLKL